MRPATLNIISCKSPAVMKFCVFCTYAFPSTVVKMRRLLCTVAILHCGVLFVTAAPEPSPQAIPNETTKENPEIRALLDYESGLIFYKDASIPACLVEKIPENILEASGNADVPTFKLPIPSKEICTGRDRELLETKQSLISESGLLFCRGLPILDMAKIPLLDKKSSLPQTHHTRRKRQSNSYYRTQGPTGEARAYTNPSLPGQSSQSQVQGQVFGSGFFSGQAQSQNSGMSQSQVQLSGVGIRGQIASSSGNAQAQLSLGGGAGSGQAAGLGEGPSSSQVQVSLARQEGDESMASASATSGGTMASIGGGPGAGALGGYSNGAGGQYGGAGGHGGRAVGPGSGFIPGTRLFDESVSPSVSRVPYGSGTGYGDGQVPGHSQQLRNGYAGHDHVTPVGRVHSLHQGDLNQIGMGGVPTSTNGFGDSRYTTGGVTGGRNGQGGSGFGTGQQLGSGSLLGTGVRNGQAGNNLGLGQLTGSPGSIGPGRGIAGGAHGQNGGGYGTQLGGTNGQGVIPSGSSTHYGNGYTQGGQVPGQNIGAQRDAHGHVPGSTLSQPGQVGSGLHTGAGSNGHYRTQGGGGGILPTQGGVGGNLHTQGGGGGNLHTQGGGGGNLHTQGGGGGNLHTQGGGGGNLHTQGGGGGNLHTQGGVGGSLPSQGGTGTGGQRGAGTYGGTVSGTNGAGYFTGGGVSGRPYSQSSTPGAYASTNGFGQAQAQTVYFGNAGNGQYIPIRYDQSSQPGGAPGIHRYQDQQVGVGSAGQRQQLSQNGGIGTSNLGTGGIGIPHGGGIAGRPQNGLRNGHATYDYGSQTGQPSLTGQQPIRNGGGATGVSPGGGVHQVHPGGGSTGTNGAGVLGPHSTTNGLGTDAAGYRQGHTGVGGSTTGQLPTVYTNEYGGGQGQPSTHTSPSVYTPGTGSPGYQNGHRQVTTTTTTNGRNGQSYVTNGYNTGGYTQQQIPTGTTNGHTYRVNGNGQSGLVPGQQPGQAVQPGIHGQTSTGLVGQDGFSPSYGISKPSQEDPDGRKCTIITFSCTIVVESNGRAKICKPNAVTMNGSGAAGGNGAAGSKICCC